MRRGQTITNLYEIEKQTTAPSNASNDSLAPKWNRTTSIRATLQGTHDAERDHDVQPERQANPQPHTPKHHHTIQVQAEPWTNPKSLQCAS